MNANELMIGDWVRMKENHGFAFQMEDVGGNGMFKRWTPDGEYMIPYSYGEIEPIPLTPEILEKNGFEEFDGWRILDMDDVEIRWIGTILEISGSHGNMELPNVQCVHELQHALRLCGIKKEIVI